MRGIAWSTAAADMRGIAKAELHIHLGGSFPIEFIRSIATDMEYDELCNALDNMNLRMDYHEAFHVFELIKNIVNSDEKIEAGTSAICRSLADDGVSYVELRTGLKDLGNGYESYLNAVLAGIRKSSAASSSQLRAVVILSLRRCSSVIDAQKTLEIIKKYRNNNDVPIVALDISGDSTVGNSEGINSIIDEIHAMDLPLTLHIGESRKESSQLQELQMWRPRRVGHAVHLTKEALEYVVANRIPIEMCLSSAVKAGMLNSFDEHPALTLLRAGHPVCICTDDPLNFSCTLSEECALAASLLGHAGIEDMLELQIKTLEYRFAPG